MMKKISTLYQKEVYLIEIGNIDLKKLISKKMDKVNHRTESAIIKLLQQKLNLDKNEIKSSST